MGKIKTAFSHGYVAAFAALVILALLVGCQPKEPTACEKERAEVFATQNAVTNYSTYFHGLVEDYSERYTPVCIHGIPYFQENDKSDWKNNLDLVPIPQVYYDYSKHFWQACMLLEQGKKPAPKDAVGP